MSGSACWGGLSPRFRTMPAAPSAREFEAYVAVQQPASQQRLARVARAVTAAAPTGAALLAGQGVPQQQPAAAAAASSDGQQLAGKSVLVTGGGTGIGQGIVLALAAEGAHVVATGRRVEPLQETVALAAGLSGSVEAVAADIADRDQTGLISHVVDTYGKLDIVRRPHRAPATPRPACPSARDPDPAGPRQLVNNAGINIPKRSLAELSLDDWHSVVDTNLHGTFHVVHAALPVMRAQQVISGLPSFDTPDA